MSLARKLLIVYLIAKIFSFVNLFFRSVDYKAEKNPFHSEIHQRKNELEKLGNNVSFIVSLLA